MSLIVKISEPVNIVNAGNDIYFLKLNSNCSFSIFICIYIFSKSTSQPIDDFEVPDGK